MNIDRIDFISFVCDRWCERCGYTSRCSAFAADAAIAMCGDDQDGLELAFGGPHPEGNDSSRIPEWLLELENIEMSAIHAAVFRRVEDARDLRTRETTIAKVADAFTTAAHHWLAARAETLRGNADETGRKRWTSHRTMRRSSWSSCVAHLMPVIVTIAARTSMTIPSRTIGMAP